MKYSVCILVEKYIHWLHKDAKKENTTKDITTLTFKHLVFDNRVILDLYGIVTFDNCTLYGHHFVINLFRSQNEPTLSHENITDIVANINELRLEFFRTQFKLTTPEGIGIIITAVNVVRSIQMLNCNVFGYPEYDLNVVNNPSIHILVGDNATSLDIPTVVTILIEQSKLDKCFINIHCYLPFSVSLITVRHVILHDSILAKVFEGGGVGFHLENCIFSASSENRPRGIHVEDGFYVYIHKCEFNIYDINCLEGCAVFVKGLTPLHSVLLQFISTFVKQ